MKNRGVVGRVWLLSVCLCCASVGIVPIVAFPATETSALETFWVAANGPTWVHQDNWNTGTDPCFWYGVTCRGDHVIGIHLSNNNVTGSLPTELKDLVAIERIFLDRNGIEGTIPPELGQLHSLEWLFLSQNRLTGSIPWELGTTDMVLDIVMLAKNRLTGSLPPSFADVDTLERFSVADNLLTGSIPAGYGFLPNLQYFSVRKNQLSGTIPETLGNITTLSFLWMHDNRLTGSIPWSLAYLPALRELSTYNNNLTPLGRVPPPLQQKCLSIKCNLWLHVDEGMRMTEVVCDHRVPGAPCISPTPSVTPSITPSPSTV